VFHANIMNAILNRPTRPCHYSTAWLATLGKLIVHYMPQSLLNSKETGGTKREYSDWTDLTAQLIECDWAYVGPLFPQPWTFMQRWANISQNALYNSPYFHLLPTVLYYLKTIRPILLDPCYYAPGDRIKRCTLSVRLSVRPVPPIFSKQESQCTTNWSEVHIYD